MRDRYRLLQVLVLLLVIPASIASTDEKNLLNLHVKPGHTRVDVIGITDWTFKATLAGTGEEDVLKFHLPKGVYYYVAQADDYYSARDIVFIPHNKNPSATLTYKSERAKSFDRTIRTAGWHPLLFFSLLSLPIILLACDLWGILYRCFDARIGLDIAKQRDQFWRKKPSPITQDRLLKHGAVIVEMALFATATYSSYMIWKTPTYEVKMLIVGLFSGILLYHLSRFTVMGLQTLRVKHLHNIWKEVHSKFEEDLDSTWGYFQPNPLDYTKHNLKSLKTNKVYQLTVNFAKDTVSKDRQYRFLGSTPKFSEQLGAWQKSVEEDKKDKQAEMAFLFLPNAKPGKLYDTETSDNVFGSGKACIVCSNFLSTGQKLNAEAKVFMLER